MKINKLKVAKFVTGAVVGSGTTTVTNSIIRNNVEPSNLWQQISVGVASVVIGSMASAATRSHTDAQIDHIVEAWQRASAQTTDQPVEA